MDLYLWKKSKWEDTNEETVVSYNRGKETICVKEEEDVFIIKRKKRRGMRVWVKDSVYNSRRII